MPKVRKALVAVAGAAVAIAGRRYGAESLIFADVVALLTAAGVYAVKNEAN